MYQRKRLTTRLTSPGRLSVVLRGSRRRIRDGQNVEVELGDGRSFVGPAQTLEDGSIRVFMPSDVP